MPVPDVAGCLEGAADDHAREAVEAGSVALPFRVRPGDSPAYGVVIAGRLERSALERVESGGARQGGTAADRAGEWPAQ